MNILWILKVLEIRAFPAIAPKDSNSFYLLNYSSNINKRDKIWIGGQLGKTYIYKTILNF